MSNNLVGNLRIYKSNINLTTMITPKDAQPYHSCICRKCLSIFSMNGILSMKCIKCGNIMGDRDVMFGSSEIESYNRAVRTIDDIKRELENIPKPRIK